MKRIEYTSLIKKKKTTTTKQKTKHDNKFLEITEKNPPKIGFFFDKINQISNIFQSFINYFIHSITTKFNFNSVLASSSCICVILG